MSYISSNIVDIQYDNFKRKLSVYFLAGGRHDFEEVPYYKYHEMIQSKSKGEYFNQKIKGVYKSEKIY